MLEIHYWMTPPKCRHSHEIDGELEGCQLHRTHFRIIELWWWWLQLKRCWWYKNAVNGSFSQSRMRQPLIHHAFGATLRVRRTTASTQRPTHEIRADTVCTAAAHWNTHAGFQTALFARCISATEKCELRLSHFFHQSASTNFVPATILSRSPRKKH